MQKFSGCGSVFMAMYLDTHWVNITNNLPENDSFQHVNNLLSVSQIPNINELEYKLLQR